MDENNKIKDLEAQARNTKHLIDMINEAYYGMTWDEHERLHGRKGGDIDETKNTDSSASSNRQ